jgi:hypothetical protein
VDPIPIPDAPPFVFLINDPANGLYRGLNPLEQPQDRVAVVHFIKHHMFNWVRVLPA